MTDNSDIFRTVTRALALLLLVWALAEVAFLPADILSLVHHLKNLRGIISTDRIAALDRYEVRYYGIYAVGRLALCCVFLWLARWLHRGGAGVREFFEADRS